jgi:predicted DCC family thiol-disulfide oxidoreductase YuxK
MVKFIIRQDKKNVFLFAPLQSKAGQKLLAEFNIPGMQSNSMVVIDDGKVYTKSTAALILWNKLPFYWKWLQLFWILPKALRDGLYSIIATNRYKWFGKKEQCMVPSPEVKIRFLD